MPPLLLLGGVILILLKPTSDNVYTDIIKIVKENGRQETRGQLESLRSPSLLTDLVICIIKRDDKNYIEGIMERVIRIQ